MEVREPKMLKEVDKSVLPVNFFGQKKAWMTGEIMKSVLTRLNQRLSIAITPLYC